MIGWTFCTGIGAPETASRGLGIDWRLGAEIDPFARAVSILRHGYKEPADHNQGDPLLWGDMTEVFPDLARSRGIPLPEIVVAGTPCQAFSVAGLRRGTEDPRGNLTLSFVESLHAIVAARPDGRLAVLWENVPGVLSDKGNAFGAFLGGLVGADDEPLPPDREWGFRHEALLVAEAGEGDEPRYVEAASVGGTWGWQRISWPREGMVAGGRTRIAWRVLDAQYFGVAQRRERVFAVIDIGGAVDPAAALFERQSLRGDTPPSRGAREGAPTIPGRSLGGGGLGADFDCDRGLVASTGEISHCLNAGGMGRQDFETETLIAHTLRGSGFDASEDGTGRGTPLVPMAIAFGAQNSASQGDGIGVEFCPTLDKSKTPGVAQGWAVRRLTPTECERLQGFPDGFTDVPWRGKDGAPDGPRYKALGNSMAVPCIRWILERMLISMGRA